MLMSSFVNENKMQIQFTVEATYNYIPVSENSIMC